MWGTIANKQQIETAIANCDLDTVASSSAEGDQSPASAQLLRVLVYESLFGKHQLKGAHPLVQCVKNHREKLKTAIHEPSSTPQAQEEAPKAKVASNTSSESAKSKKQQDTAVSLPVYARVNTLKTSKATVLGLLVDEGFKVTKWPPGAGVRTLQEDPFVANLLAFAPSIPIQKHRLTQSGQLVLQDRGNVHYHTMHVDLRRITQFTLYHS